MAQRRPYKYKPPVAIEIVLVPSPDGQARLSASIKLVADAIARRAWDEAVAEVTAEMAAEDAARLAAGQPADDAPAAPPNAAPTSPNSSPRLRAKKPST